MAYRNLNQLLGSYFGGGGSGRVSLAAMAGGPKQQVKLPGTVQQPGTVNNLQAPPPPPVQTPWPPKPQQQAGPSNWTTPPAGTIAPPTLADQAAGNSQAIAEQKLNQLYQTPNVAAFGGTGVPYLKDVISTDPFTGNQFNYAKNMPNQSFIDLDSATKLAADYGGTVVADPQSNYGGQGLINIDFGNGKLIPAGQIASMISRGYTPEEIKAFINAGG